VEKNRLEAFSDGVIAIIITIMVLELKVPHGAGLSDLAGVLPVFLSYVLSFLYIAIYWNNHHHLLQTVHRVDGLMLWANTHLLFWLSLVPFATAWMGENNFASVPTAVYGVALFMPAVAYFQLEKAILRKEGPNSTLAKALGKDIKGKLSPFFIWRPSSSPSSIHTSPVRSMYRLASCGSFPIRVSSAPCQGRNAAKQARPGSCAALVSEILALGEHGIRSRFAVESAVDGQLGDSHGRKQKSCVPPRLGRLARLCARNSYRADANDKWGTNR
jgi:uncharacterized membrane protein